MSIRDDGKNRCDRCGTDVGNGGITLAVQAFDYTEEGQIIDLHWCRTPRDGAPRGCAGTVAGGAAVADRDANGLPQGAAHH